MTLRSVFRLVRLPLAIAPLAGPLLVLLVLLLEALALGLGLAGPSAPPDVLGPLLGAVGIVGFFSLSFLGQGLRAVARPETRLLPGFRRSLAVAGAVWFFFLWLVPLALAGGLGLLPPAALVGIGGLVGLLFVWVLVVNAWPMPRGMLPVILAFLAFPAFPPAIRHVLLVLALAPLTGALALALALALLRRLSRHLFAPSDPPAAEAPLSAVAWAGGGSALRASPRLATARSASPSRLRTRLDAWITAPVERKLEKRLRALRVRPDRTRRVRAVRLLLMPAEGPRGWLVRWFILLVVLGFYYALVFARGTPTPAFARLAFDYVVDYVVMAGFASLSVIPLARERTRRHLAELYLTLGLETPREFRAVVADAYLGLLPGTVVITLALLVPAALLLEPARLLAVVLAALVVLPSLALFVLAVLLHMPERTLPRALLGIPLLGAVFVALPLTLGAMRAFGTTAGALLAAVAGTSVAVGTWQTSRRLWMESPLDFGTPDPRLPL